MLNEKILRREIRWLEYFVETRVDRLENIKQEIHEKSLKLNKMCDDFFTMKTGIKEGSVVKDIDDHIYKVKSFQWWAYALPRRLSHDEVPVIWGISSGQLKDFIVIVNMIDGNELSFYIPELIDSLQVINDKR